MGREFRSQVFDILATILGKVLSFQTLYVILFEETLAKLNTMITDNATFHRYLFSSAY